MKSRSRTPETLIYTALLKYSGVSVEEVRINSWSCGSAELRPATLIFRTLER
jgi:hypothetical protein